MTKIKTHSRQELDINFFTAFTAALVLTVIIYILFLPLKESYVGVLLYQRGLTQYFTVFFASLVAVISINKYLKIQTEQKVLKKLVCQKKFLLIIINQHN